LSGERILVTGSTGNVGREVLIAVARSGFLPRAGMRRPEESSGILEGVETFKLDFQDSDTWHTTLQGVDHLFLMRPPAIANVEKTLNPFIDLAYENGIRHIVFLSVAGAERNRFVPHAKVERHLRAKGVSHTNLRPGFFAQNLQDAYLRDINEDDRIILPAGHAKVNWIDVRDVADVAASVFQDPKRHQGMGYTLTGPAPVSWSHVTEVLSAVVGRLIRYEAVSVLAYFLHLHRRRLPFKAIIVQTILHTLLRYGQGAFVSSDLEMLLGRKGRTIETYIRDHADVWRTEPST